MLHLTTAVTTEQALHPVETWRGERRWIAAAAAGATALLMVIAMVVLHAVDGVDELVRRSAVSLRSPGLTMIETAVTDLGSYRFVLVEALALALIIAWLSRRVLPSVLLLVAVGSTSSIEYLLKIAISRPRPPADLALGAPATDYSFPSGHTTSGSTVFLLGALLVAAQVHRRLLARLVVLSGVLVAGAIGLSRVYLGYHWFSDVLGGWLLALTLTAVAIAVLALSPTGLGRSRATTRESQIVGVGVDSSR